MHWVKFTRFSEWPRNLIAWNQILICCRFDSVNKIVLKINYKKIYVLFKIPNHSTLDRQELAKTFQGTAEISCLSIFEFEDLILK
jgi:hypothetical protein